MDMDWNDFKNWLSEIPGKIFDGIGSLFEKALKAFDDIPLDCVRCEYKDCKFCTDKITDIVHYALEKQIAKKPIMKPIDFGDGKIDEDCKDYHCPTCGDLLTDYVDRKYQLFCMNCGQKLDWSDLK